MPKDKKSRIPLYKSITYRILGSLFTAITAYILTGSIVLSSSMGIIEITLKTLVYYLHEKLWVIIEKKFM